MTGTQQSPKNNQIIIQSFWEQAPWEPASDRVLLFENVAPVHISSSTSYFFDPYFWILCPPWTQSLKPKKSFPRFPYYFSWSSYVRPAVNRQPSYRGGDSYSRNELLDLPGFYFYSIYSWTHHITPNTSMSTCSVALACFRACKVFHAAPIKEN